MGCVAEGQTVFLMCEEGHEVISNSAMSVLELMCHNGKIDLWEVELCVPVRCDFPRDWVEFTGTHWNIFT